MVVSIDEQKSIKHLVTAGNKQFFYEDLAVPGTMTELVAARDDFKKGKENALMFLVGQVMRHTKGKANPDIVNKLLKKRLQEE